MLFFERLGCCCLLFSSAALMAFGFAAALNPLSPNRKLGALAVALGIAGFVIALDLGMAL
jgi:hypothetical protein